MTDRILGSDETQVASGLRIAVGCIYAATAALMIFTIVNFATHIVSAKPSPAVARLLEDR